MQLLRPVVEIYRSAEPEAAFRAMADALGASRPLHCAVWLGPDHSSIVCTHPEGVRVPAEMLTIAGHVSRPEVFPVSALSPLFEHPWRDADMLLLPLPERGSPGGAVVLIAEKGAFGDDVEVWAELGAALADAGERHRVLLDAREESSTHRKRAQEMEALDVLGLAANQTLDMKEVLTLVVRFTRTLLGAHYALVETLHGGEIHASESVGLRAEVDLDHDRFAWRVIDAGQPVVLHADDEDFTPEAFPRHAAEGMQVGLGVPLALFGETFGALVVGYRDPCEVTARDTLLALTLARHAAVAINNARLHERLAQHSAELERTYAELHESTRLKERFFASMSHELRTPVNAIVGFQNLVLDGRDELTPGTRRYLEKSNRAAHNLLRLVDEILDYARIEAGSMTVNPRPVALRDLAEEAICPMESLAAEKRLVLRASMPEDAGQILTDPDRVRQILLNLLSNAIKFSAEDGDVSLAVIMAGDGAWVEFRVEDSGPGIAPENHDAIFREFEQVPGTRGGTGLGLPIARKLSRLLGGDLLVQSELGTGSTFVLRLPASLPHPVSSRVPAGVA
jgi:signal transduction histidine kinase